MKWWVGCIGAASVLLSVISPANAFPDGPVRLLVGWPAGGPVDVVARLVQGELSKRLGTSVIIENKPGASGMLATDLLLSQRRDGQTLLLCTHYESMNPVMYRSAKYKVEDLAGISLLARYYLVMTTAEKSPFRNIADVVDYAKKNPGKLTYGTSGPGSTQDMLMRQLGDLTGTTMQTVPFRGAPPALTEVVAGRLDTFLSSDRTGHPTGRVWANQTSGFDKPLSLEGCAGCADLRRTGVSPKALRVDRDLRRQRHAGTNHRSIEPRDYGGCQV